MKFKLLKKFEGPSRIVQSGTIKTIKEWAEFFSIEGIDVYRNVDWFLPIDEDKYLVLDTVTLKELEENYPKLLYTIQTDFPDLEIGKVCKIASYVLSTCESCHNEPSSCVCGKDIDYNF